MENENVINLDEPSFEEKENQSIVSTSATLEPEHQMLVDSAEDYMVVLDEIKKNSVPFVGLIWKIIEKNNVDLNILLLKDIETFQKEQQEILEKLNKNDYDYNNFQIPALTNYNNWSRLLMDFLFKTYNINEEEQKKIMQGENGYSDEELQNLILKNTNLSEKHNSNAHNVLCAGLTEILLGYFQNMEYTKTTTFEKKNKNKNKQEASNLYIYDARLREVLRQFIKGIMKEYQNISQKNFEKELALKLEKKNKEDTNEGKSLEVRLNEDMNLFKRASKEHLNEVQEDVKMEFSSIIPEVENRVSCLLWEQYEKAQEEQKKKQAEKENTYINKDEKSSANNKWLMWGLATVGSGLIIGVTGGLAAPLVGAGLGTIGLGLESLAGLIGLTTTGLVAGIGTFLTTTSGVAIFGALFGLTGGGLTAYNFHRAFSGLKEFKFIELPYQGTDPDINEYIEKKKKEKETKENGDTLKNNVKYSVNDLGVENPLNTVTDNVNIETTFIDNTTNDNTNDNTIQTPRINPMKLHVIICISGWLSDIKDIYKPWECILNNRNTMSSNVYVLKFDSKILINLGQAMESMILSGSISFGVKQLLKQTILSGVVTGLIWPVALVQMGTMVDNPWTSGLDKAEKAGKVLAREVLLKYVHGKRPVTLVGYSLGARVIYYCLIELWNYTFELSMKKQEEESFLSWNRFKRNNDSANNEKEEIEKAKYLCHTIVDSVYLLGSPVESDPIHWTKIRAMTSGRVINGYCKTDWILSFLFRASSISNHIAGLQPVEVEGVENIDLTDIVGGHLEYKDKLEEILEYIGFEDGIIVTH